MADLLMINHSAGERTITIALFGEMDLASRDLLAAMLDTCIASTTGDICLDCAELEFIDAASIGVLARVHAELERSDRRLTVVRAKPNISKVFHLTDLDHLLRPDDSAQSVTRDGEDGPRVLAGQPRVGGGT